MRRAKRVAHKKRPAKRVVHKKIIKPDKRRVGLQERVHITGLAKKSERPFVVVGKVRGKKFISGLSQR